MTFKEYKEYVKREFKYGRKLRKMYRDENNGIAPTFESEKERQDYLMTKASRDINRRAPVNPVNKDEITNKKMKKFISVNESYKRNIDKRWKSLKHIFILVGAFLISGIFIALTETKTISFSNGVIIDFVILIIPLVSIYFANKKREKKYIYIFLISMDVFIFFTFSLFSQKFSDSFDTISIIVFYIALIVAIVIFIILKNHIEENEKESIDE